MPFLESVTRGGPRVADLPGEHFCCLPGSRGARISRTGSGGTPVGIMPKAQIAEQPGGGPGAADRPDPTPGNGLPRLRAGKRS